MVSLTPVSRARLADLPADVLVGVADALALVGLRRPRRANVRRELADRACLSMPSTTSSVAPRPRPTAPRNGHVDGVGEAERQVQLVPGDLGAVADALDLQPLREALGHAVTRFAVSARARTVGDRLSFDSSGRLKRTSPSATSITICSGSFAVSDALGTLHLHPPPASPPRRRSASGSVCFPTRDIATRPRRALRRPLWLGAASRSHMTPRTSRSRPCRGRCGPSGSPSAPT